ncbi:hypothetical protein EYC59_02760 [Candidatus Saccharibacteria bacterium]|nr:MAG: hypothetical protein EYC59_02760 [Candidatus Saccharibacteria bacterium]
MKLRSILLRVAIGIVGSFLLVSVAAAADTAKKDSTTTTTKTTTAASLQGYASDTALQVGTVVQLAGGGAAKVAPATEKKLEQMYGIVVDPRTLSLTLSSSGLQNEAYVATTGTYNALVSDQQGVVKTGDYVTLSAIDGVAMKASADQKIVLGRAAGNFDGKTNLLGTLTLKDTTGKEATTAHLGMIPVAIDIRHNPIEKSTKANMPPWLQRLGEAVAEKPVGPLRIYLSIAITGLSVIVALVLLYSGVRHSIISIGRNPLSKKTIFRGLIEIILTSIIVLIIGMFAVYLLLRL